MVKFWPQLQFGVESMVVSPPCQPAHADGNKNFFVEFLAVFIEKEFTTRFITIGTVSSTWLRGFIISEVRL